VTNRDVLEEAYNFYALKYIRAVPTPSLPGVKTILEQLALKNPKAEAANPEDFVDSRFVNELEKSGFVANLYKQP
jgi:signal recognition particle subunit SEC65